MLLSCKRIEYNVDEVRLIHQEVIEREYKQTGKRILREQRRKTYSDTIRTYRVVLSNNSIVKTIYLNKKPKYKKGDKVYEKVVDLF